MRRFRTALGVLFAAFTTPVAAAEVRSPDGRIAIIVDVDERGTPNYSVTFEDASVILDSRLGLRFRTRTGFDRGLEVVSTSSSSHDDTWEQPWGERRLVVDRHNEMRVRFAAVDAPDRTLTLRLCAFDDGVDTVDLRLAAGGGTAIRLSAAD